MEQEDYAANPEVRPRSRWTMRRFLALLGLLVLAGGGFGWMVSHGKLDGLLPGRSQTESTRSEPAPAELADGPAAPDDQAAISRAQTELAELEARMAQLNLQASSTTSQALRAENLLTAMASRRAIERGRPLGYLENQLKLRFSGAQAKAVDTLMTAGRSPVTLDSLIIGLDGLSGAAKTTDNEQGGWTSIKRAVGDLFIVHKRAVVALTADDRILRAKAALLAGRLEAAIVEVEALGSGDQGKAWIEKASRYAEMQTALDTLEEAALLGLPAVIAAEPAPLSPPLQTAPSPEPSPEGPVT